MIKAVTFDLDGVYFTSESFRRFKFKLSSDVQATDKVFHKSEQAMLFRLGKIEEAEFWQFVKNELNLRQGIEDIFKLLGDSYERNGDVVGYVRKLKSEGIKTCICSNNFITRVRELDKKFDFLKDFDAKIFSFEVGVIKPDKKIFEELVGQAGVSPGEMVYSDDDEKKLVGAIELGIKAFVYEGFEKFREEVESLRKGYT